MPSRFGAVRFAVVLAIAAVAWRLLFVIVVIPRWEAAGNLAPFPDHYPDLALSLLRAHTLSHDVVAGAPTTTRGPGFPLWLAPGIVLGGESTVWVGLWASLPGIAAGVLLAARVRRSFGTVPGLVSALCALFHPLVCIASARAMGDDFFAATGVLSAWLVFDALDAERPRRALAGGCGAAALLALHLVTRANGILTVVAIAAGVATAQVGAGRRRGGPDDPVLRSRRPAAQAARALLVTGVLAAALLPALAWSVRSSRLEGRPVYVHSLAAYNFWLHQQFEESGYRFPPSVDVKAALLREAGLDPAQARRLHWADLRPPEVARLEQGLTRAALRFAARRPLALLARTLTGLPRFWFQASSARTTAAYALLTLPFLLLAILGAWRHVREPGRCGPFGTALLATLVLHNALYALMLPMARMSVQVYPALAYFAGAGAFALIGRWRAAS